MTKNFNFNFHNILLDNFEPSEKSAKFLRQFIR